MGSFIMGQVYSPGAPALVEDPVAKVAIINMLLDRGADLELKDDEVSYLQYEMKYSLL